MRRRRRRGRYIKKCFIVYKRIKTIEECVWRAGERVGSFICSVCTLVWFAKQPLLLLLLLSAHFIAYQRCSQFYYFPFYFFIWFDFIWFHLVLPFYSILHFALCCCWSFLCVCVCVEMNLGTELQTYNRIFSTILISSLFFIHADRSFFRCHLPFHFWVSHVIFSAL